jgi:hypothetical protein
LCRGTGAFNLNRRWLAAILLGLVAAGLLLWLARATIAARFANAYFRQHGVESAVEIGSLGLSGVSGRFSLGPKDAPDVAVERIELFFDPLSWTPRVVEVRLVDPVVRVRLDADGKPRFGSLQDWIDSLNRQQGKSRFVSDDLAVSLTGLRLLLATPGGELEVNGNVKLVKNIPVSAVLHARPTMIAWKDTRLSLRAADIAFDNASGHLAAHFLGAVNTSTLAVPDLEARLEAQRLKWFAADRRFSISAPSANLQLSAGSLAGVTAPKLNIAITRFSAVPAGQNLQAQADLKADGALGLSVALLRLRSTDPALAATITQNLARLQIGFAGHATRHGAVTEFSLTSPLTVIGAKGGRLSIPQLTLSGASDSLNAAVEASLSGPGLPAAQLISRRLMWSGGGLTGDAALTARFNFAMLRGADIAANGTVSWEAGHYAFAPSGCTRIALAAFHPGAGDLAKDIRTQVCATPGTPLITGEGLAWKLSGEARDASANLPLGNARVEKAAAHLAFEGQGAPLSGTATVSTAQMSDLTTPIRSKPLLASGTVALAEGVWRGRFAMTDPQKNPLGETIFSHTMATGSGTAHISAPGLSFAPDKLQPESLSPLLVAFRHAEGTVAFSGDVNWTRSEITSQGKLSVAALDFLTPLGKAHAVKTDIAFTSLLPPVTAPGQGLTISRIDWTLPFSAVNVRFGFSATEIQVGSAETDIAEGHAALGAFTVKLADPGRIAGAAKLTGIALGSLITASNLGSKLKLEGKVSGTIPFAMGPEGFRITNGHIAADGPGRLSVNRSLWAQGEAAISSNAVQDMAYQALENLAFEQMTAELNSVAGGRLQIVFHIKGKSDPPKPQVAEVAIADIINGTALYKPIPLPSGTPIDLTLDTSLNFDELLKSYAEAWSKSLNPEGHPDLTPGAKP